LKNNEPATANSFKSALKLFVVQKKLSAFRKMRFVVSKKMLAASKKSNLLTRRHRGQKRPRSWPPHKASLGAAQFRQPRLQFCR